MSHKWARKTDPNRQQNQRTDPAQRTSIEPPSGMKIAILVDGTSGGSTVQIVFDDGPALKDFVLNGLKPLASKYGFKFSVDETEVPKATLPISTPL